MKSASLLLSFLSIIVSSYQAKYIFIHDMHNNRNKKMLVEDVHTGRDGKKKIFFLLETIWYANIRTVV